MLNKVASNNRLLEFNGSKLDMHVHFSCFYESSYYKLFQWDGFQNALVFLGLEKKGLINADLVH
jgi:hypothetical protein